MDYQELKRMFNTKYGFMLHNGIRCTDIGPDTATFAADLMPAGLNPHGVAHGGLLYTLADNATGAAVHSDGRRYVTLNSSFNYLRMAREGTIVANARVVKRGKTVAVAECTVECGGHTLATGSFTFYCLDK